MTITKVITGPDYALMRRVNRWRPPRWVRWWMIAATRAGDGWLWAVSGLAILLSHSTVRYLALEAAALAIATGIVLFRAIKKSVGRPRPCTIEPHCWATLLPPDQFSFPSGHTITAFAAAISLGYFYPVLVPALLFSAASVAASRVVLGMHFLSDVLAGALVGWILGYSAVQIVTTL